MKGFSRPNEVWLYSMASDEHKTISNYLRIEKMASDKL